MEMADRCDWDFGAQRTKESRPFLQGSDGNEPYFLQVFTYRIREWG